MKINYFVRTTSSAVLLISVAMNANANILSADAHDKNFAINGDVEFNINYQNKESADRPGIHDEFKLNQDGRVEFNFTGAQNTGDYRFEVKVTPGYKTSGDLYVSDVWFSVLKENSGGLKVGRFKAFDMSPAGQDTFVDHYGDTADGTVSDSHPYMYRMLEGRGRGKHGQIMYNQSFDNLYVELSMKLGDGMDLFGGSKTYHGKTITPGNDIFLVRPVVAYQFGNLKIAAGMEANLANDSATITVNNKQVDILDRKGYGFSGRYTAEDFYLNLSYSVMDAADEDNTTYVLNGGYKGFCLGYMAAKNQISTDETDGTFAGDVYADTLYTSYKFSNVLNVEDFAVYVGAYQSTAEEKNVTRGAGQYKVDGKHDKGLRLRMKYNF